jgi:ATP-dependent Lon protease
MFREGVVFRSVFTRQLFDLSDEMATKLDIEFYKDGRDALLKALAD